MAYGSIKVDNIIYDDSGDVTLPISSIQSSISGILTVTGDIKTTGGDVVAEAGIFVGTLGAAATPTYTFSGDNNTGLYASAADQISITTSGTAKLTVKSDGNVGIGTTDPSVLLHVKESSGAHANIILENSEGSAKLGTNSNVFYVESSQHIFYNVGASTEYVRIDSSGELLVGLTAAVGEGGTPADLNSTEVGRGFINLSRDDTAAADHILFGKNGSIAASMGTDTTNTLVFKTGTTEAMRIDSSGRLLVGTSTNTDDYMFQVDSNAYTVAQFTRYGADGAFVVIGSSRGTQGSKTALGVNDFGGVLEFKAYQGSAFSSIASIRAACEAGAASGDTPGRLTFSTTADNASTATERMRIDSSGYVGIGESNPAVPLDVKRATAAEIAQFYDIGSNGDALHNGGPIVGLSRISDGSVSLAGLLFQVGIDTSSSPSYNIDETVFCVSNTGVGIGTSSPVRKLHLHEASSDGCQQRFTNTTTGTGASDGFEVGIGGGEQAQIWNYEETDMIFGTDNDERMSITADGSIRIGQSSTSQPGDNNNTQGVCFRGNDGTASNVGRFYASAGSDHNFNRTGDGTILAFRSAGVNEGAVSISGTTVTYGGGHLARWSQLLNNVDPSEILKGTVMSNLDEMCDWGEEDNEQLNRTKISDIEGDPNVAGVFVSTSFNDEGPFDFYVGMTGDMVIRIAQGTTVARGDLLMSAGDGTAKPQDDDIVRSKTIAKVTSTNVSETYADGSYCVPCVLMAC